MELVYIGKEKTKVRLERMGVKKEIKPGQRINIDDSERLDVILSTGLFKVVETTDASNKKVIKKEKEKREKDKSLKAKKK